MGSSGASYKLIERNPNGNGPFVVAKWEELTV